LVKDVAPDLGKAIKIVADIYTITEKANLVVIATDHQGHRNPDLRWPRGEMTAKCGIADGRHVVDPHEAISMGFDYEEVPRPKEALY
jgi:UDP-N-acetyl-D-mannosaminuronate dehydrogenase